MNKKFVALISSVVMLGSSIALAACGDDNKNQFTVAYLSGGRGERNIAARKLRLSVWKQAKKKQK